MPSSDIPILLTSSAIAHDTGVAMIDPAERIDKTLESIAHWLAIDPRLEIVICDGSGFDFSNLIATRFPTSTIECLNFMNDVELVRTRGRGYGEGEIVRYAINHSKRIASAGCFAKCTAKLWVQNYPKCLALWNGKMLFKGVFTNVFSPVRPTVFSYVDTRFYLISIDAYRQYFENAHHAVHAQRGHSLEECFRDRVLEYRLKRALFRTAPIIYGAGGGTGTYYKNRAHRRLKEWLRLWLVRLHPQFRRLF